MSGDVAKTLGEPGRIAVIAASRNLCATRHRVPRRIRPLDRATARQSWSRTRQEHCQKTLRRATSRLAHHIASASPSPLSSRHRSCLPPRGPSAPSRKALEAGNPRMIRRVLDGLYLLAGWLAGLFLIGIFLLMMAMSLGHLPALRLNVTDGDQFVAWSMAAVAFLGLAHTFK